MMLFSQPQKKEIARAFVYTMSAAIIMISCGVSKPISTVGKYTQPKSVSLRNLHSNYSGKMSNSIKRILNDAERYLGAPYQYGGNTSSGFDCSGFTVKVFEENDYKLPRKSEEQAMIGEKIPINKIQPGDLLFFATSGGNRASHVGIVHDVANDGEVKFIHASTSRGVIISSLNEKYWNKAYLHARRVL